MTSSAIVVLVRIDTRHPGVSGVQGEAHREEFRDPPRHQPWTTMIGTDRGRKRQFDERVGEAAVASVAAATTSGG
jgi:hypothetical protein